MLEDVQPHIDNIQQNKQYWKQAAERAAAAALIAANSANMERVSSQFALRTDGSSLLAAAGGSGGDGSGLATAGNNTNNQNSSSNIPAITPPPLTSQPTIMTDAIRKTFSKAAASKDSLPENNSDNNIVQIPTIRQTNSKTDIFTSKLSSAASNSHNGSNSRLVANRILADATGPKPRHMGSTGRDSIGLSQNNSTSSLAGGGGGAGVSLLGYNTSTGFLETTYSATIPHDRSHTKNVSSLSKLGDIIGSDQTRPLHSASISNRSLQIENSQGGLRLTSGNVVVGVGASSQSSAAGGQPDAISQNILLSTHMTSTLTGSVISTVSPLEQHHPVFRQNSSTSRSITITAASVAGRDAEGGGGSSSVPSVQNGSIPLMSVNSDSIHSAMSVAGEHDGAPSHLNLAPRGGN